MIRCKHCGCRYDDHRLDGRCPRTKTYGYPAPFPSFRSAGASKEADAKLDRALAQYWSASTHFQGVR